MPHYCDPIALDEISVSNRLLAGPKIPRQISCDAGSGLRAFEKIALRVLAPVFRGLEREKKIIAAATNQK